MMKDWTGQKFFLLTFVKPIGKAKDTAVIWELQCDCGNTTTSIATRVRLGKKKSCGCINTSKARRKDWTGQKFGQLTFIRPLEEWRDTCSFWECLCECGNITKVLPKFVAKGITKNCGCIRIRKRDFITDAETARLSTAREVYNAYKRRDNGIAIDFNKFLEITQENCFYCGSPPMRTRQARGTVSGETNFRIEHGSFTYNGIDRIDNAKGYSIGNIVPCCTYCNRAKNDRTVKDFLDWVNRVANHIRNK